MLFWILVYLITNYCEVLGTPPITVVNDVGVLSLKQPTFVGRNVTFEFTPSTQTALADVSWKYIKRKDSVVETIGEDDKDFIVQDEGTSLLLLIPNVDRSFNGTTVYTEADFEEMSPMIELSLKDYTDANRCGEFYLLSDRPILVGDDVKFGYFPSPEVANEKNASKYFVELNNGSNENHTSVPRKDGVFELHMEGDEYILTLFNITKSTNGFYWVQCADGFSGLAGTYSNSIHLFDKDKPVIGPLTTISTCTNCILFNTDETLAKVSCNLKDHFSDARIMFTIGSNTFNSTKRSPTHFGLQSNQKPSASYHRLNASCIVNGLNRTTSAQATIYLLVNPSGPPHLSASPVLLEGDTVNVTCKSSKARPPPKLTFFVENTEIVSNISHTFGDYNGLYRSVSKLHTFKKDWGNKKLSCQQIPEVVDLYYLLMSNELSVDYKYPPSQIILVVNYPDNFLRTFSASCTAFDSNPVCQIKWQLNMPNFKYNIQDKSIMKNSNVSTITFNVTDDYFGKQLSCIADCPDFKNAGTNSKTLVFAKKPKVVIHSSPDFPVPPLTRITLTCEANAYPHGNITWTSMKTSIILLLCTNASTCTYELTTSDVEQEYFCIATNEHGIGNGSIVTVKELRDKTDRLNKKAPGSSGIVTVIGVVVGITFLIIVIAAICLYRRRKQAKLQLEANQTEMAQLQSPTAGEGDRDEVPHAQFDGAEYAVIDKVRRDPENPALPSSKAKPSCDAHNEYPENAATADISVHVEQPSSKDDVIAAEPGPSKQPDVREGPSDGDETTTENGRVIDVSEQSNISKRDAPKKELSKRSTNELVYADVDVEHLERCRGGETRTCDNEQPTEYSSILFDTSCAGKPDSSIENVYND